MPLTKKIAGRTYRNTYTGYSKARAQEYRERYGRARGVRGTDGVKRIYVNGRRRSS